MTTDATPGLPVAQAAQRLGLTPAALRKRIKRGSVPAVKAGEQWYVSLAALDAAPAPAPLHGAGEQGAGTSGGVNGVARRGETGYDAGHPARDEPEQVAAGGAAAGHPTGYDAGYDAGYPAEREVQRLEAHVTDLRAIVDEMRTELSTRRRELDEERDAHHRQLQALMALLGQSQQLQLAPPAENGVVGDSEGDDGDEDGEAGPRRAPGPDPAPSEAHGRRVTAWWRRAWRWMTTDQTPA